MPSIQLPYLNIALDSFALIVTVIILVACIGELSDNKIGATNFLLLLSSVTVALIADIIGWIGEGRIALYTVTLTADTVSACASNLAIIGFMGYLVSSLYSNSRAAVCVLNMLRVICALSLMFCIGNAFFGYAFYIDEGGHYTRTEDAMMGFLYLLFPMLSFFAAVLMALFARSSGKLNRLVFFIYTLFPAVGLILDYVFHGVSFTYVGFTVSVLIMYTSIYLKKQKALQAQKRALMLSQINPHFVYNTLSTIAAMCDTSPKQAKYLTIDFSRYLRRNIDSLTSEELIPFAQEMEHVECYLKIEKARFRERLNLCYSIQCKDFRVPPLTVQPLVENAIKHGITKKAEGGTVRICTYEEETQYVIVIIDDGVGFDTENVDTHVGLENVRSRIATLCKGDLTVKSTVGVGTRVTVEIPKKKGKRQ